MDPEEKAAKDAEVRKEAEKLASKQGPGPDFTMGGPKRKTAEYFMPQARQIVEKRHKEAAVDAASMQKKGGEQPKEPTKGTAQTEADANQKPQSQFVDFAANMKKKAVDQSKFTKKP
jgi:hypothetical protein